MFANKHKEIMENFLKEKISADEFQTQYLESFKKWDDTLFEILNGVFES